MNPASGGLTATEFDFGASPIGGLPAMSRDFSNLTTASEPGPIGSGWFSSTLPTLQERPDGILVYTGLPRRAVYFERQPMDDGFKPLFFSKTQIAPENDTFAVTGSTGMRVLFENVSGTPGKLLGFVQPDGTPLDFEPDGSDRVTSLTRVVDPEAGIINGYYFSYLDASTSLIDTITLRVAGQDVRRVRYDYYTVEEGGKGKAGDMRMAVTEFYNAATGDWDEARRIYYRYYTAEWTSGNHGYIGGLKFRVNGEGWRRMVAQGIDPLAATDDELKPFSELYLEYEEESRRITLLRRNGREEYTFIYDTREPDWGPFTTSDFNRWTLETTQTLPDGNKFIYYANQYRQTVAKIFVETSTGNQWCRLVVRDTLGRVVMEASPSAVVGEFDRDVLPIDQIADDVGVVRVNTFDSEKNLQDVILRQGKTGAERVLSRRKHDETREVNGIGVSFLTEFTVFREEGEDGPATTQVEYLS